MIGGKQSTRSVRRISASSQMPRAQAATMPTVVPMAAPSSTTVKPASSDRRAPCSRREKTSRPSTSVPSQCAVVGGCSRFTTSCASGG